jgi:L-ascorbate metabolism protein UlaG (beta-lactamase superfamily)
MGFIIKNEEGSIYFAGDTALTLDMQLIPRWATLSAAILPIGDNFTMDIEDAVAAAHFCGTQKVIGVHYDTFGFIKIDHQAAIDTFAASGIELLLPKIGETIEI